MWLCVLYSPPLILHWQLAFTSPRSHYCMNVTECFVFPSLLLSLQMAFASACSLPQPSEPRYWGLGVRLGNSEGWKPQKVGGCGWSRCPRNRILSHVAKDMAYSWFVAVGIWSFWGPF